MQRVLTAIAILTSLLLGVTSAAAGPLSAQSAPKRQPQVRVALIAEKTSVRPGETITVAIRETIAPGWHTYWRNPGSAGEPTSVEWTLPAGAAAGELQWPVPEVIAIGALTNYGYSGEVLLLADITLPQTLSGPTAGFTGNVKWLACKDICVPEEATVSLSLPLSDAQTPPQPSPHADEFAAARASLPAAAPWPAALKASADTLMLHLQNFEPLPADSKIRLFPIQPDVIDDAKPQVAAFADGALTLRMARAAPGVAPPTALDGVLTIETKGGGGQIERRGYRIGGAVQIAEGTPPLAPRPDIPVHDGPAPRAAASSAVPDASVTLAAPSQPLAQAREELSFGVALAFAFLGGLILNLMPCVFPVLTLKALSLAREAAPAERQIHGAAYLIGVLVSCCVVATALVVLRAGGEIIGWGMQFQSPAFVLGMMVLFLALGLNMSGVFELGGRLMGAGDSLTRVPGFTGYFFTGVLAVLVATPCTAPFMGAAIGYAFTQTEVKLFAVLLALGLGFALPMLTLSYLPMLGRWLPKPGAWMATFKELMAFPLYAAAGWMLWVLSVQLGSDGVFAGLVTLIGTAFAAWLVGPAHEPHPLRSAIAAAVAVAAITAGVVSLPAASGLKYQTFSTARLDALRAAHKPVFVNLTAAWCITCKVNERMALRSDRIVEAFAARGIVPLKGDWTNADPEITATLQHFGRAGVPLYLLYAADGGEPQVLPQILTEGIVMDSVAAMPPRRQAKSE